jgi:hypothetical protein
LVGWLVWLVALFVCLLFVCFKWKLCLKGKTGRTHWWQRDHQFLSLPQGQLGGIQWTERKAHDMLEFSSCSLIIKAILAHCRETTEETIQKWEHP